MSGLHIDIISSVGSLTNGIFTLPTEGNFKVSIKEYQNELKALSKKYFEDTFAPQKLEEKRDLLFEKYKTVKWVWSLVPTTKNSDPSLLIANEKFLGINEDGEKTFNFPQLLVGGGIIYLEAFLPDQQPTGNTGIFVTAKGKPNFLRTEWTDFNNNPLDKATVKYGSEVLLHVYTKDLYNQNIQIQLFDKEKVFGDRHLNISDQWDFQRKVKKGELLAFESSESGIGGNLIDPSTNKSVQFVQKVVVKVKIESAWEYIVKNILGNNDIEIYAKVFHNKEELKILVESPFLIIKEDGKLYDEPEEVTNQPVLVDDSSLENQNETKELVNFTFGIFLDGTLNNMYNTELRQKASGEAVPNASGMVVDEKGAKIIYKDMSSKKVYNDPEKGDTSFENDLSNPAILFKNYTEKPSEKIFRVYTEGIGSNSAPQKQGDDLKTEDYKKDDMMQGPAFGMGTAGIKNRVRDSITDVVRYIDDNLTKDKKLGTITFDVFGFSRGAAAARHFVHIVKHAAYKPNQSWFQGDNDYVKDLQGNNVDSTKYFNQLMPRFGVLGQKLNDLGLLDDRTKVDVRFVGIYDTVPHHGLFQWNDIKDLGLDNVNKANYVVHMIAGDEHRANFSLVDISSVNKTSPESGQKGGIEIMYPGVHCDVGGAYVEGWGENPTRIESAPIKQMLEPYREKLIHQGWFKEKQIFIKFDPLAVRLIAHNTFRLEAKREHLSNQYSYIPLHLMNEIYKKRGLTTISEEKLLEFKNFRENTLVNGIEGNINFLNGIKAILRKQTFDGGQPLLFKKYETYKEPAIVHAPEDTKAGVDWQKRQQEGQLQLNAKIDKENEVIRFLRNHYLHWNATYNIANFPNIEKGIRKRNIL
ncbi:T6SS phospholipase effector Tle1-like catalytic domain-containing protein [Chryseobacterium sp.]|uniref:T6SS phospholipase effector Tle1-like catalytic domain-containing protein n=1 Tax=Chryseobacterium sp. TaxID=1871047 RepID=UPI00388FC86D